MKTPIIDTSVIVDILLSSRDRHEVAAKLGDYLVEKKVLVRAPTFSLFELAAALRHEKDFSSDFRPGKLADNTSEAHPLYFEFVDVDQGFFLTYFDDKLPYTKAGDLLLLSMAKTEQRPLVTEDKGLRDRAQSVGVEVFSTVEYLEVLGL
jgi:predicted nucleic acid-binding protein